MDHIAKPDPPHPVGDGEYVVEQGECMGSIAYEHGFLEQTLWNHPENVNLAIGPVLRKAAA